MSMMIRYSPNAVPLSHAITSGTEIASMLAEQGVLFERWQTLEKITSSSNQDEILAVYAGDVARLKERYGFASADVICVYPENPQRAAIRAKFLNEHTHSDFEVRFFVAGRGLFFLHIDNNVYAVLCEQGDLISVPAHTPHWFDMGTEPELTCIRLFTTEAGWVAQFTENASISTLFPDLENFRSLQV